MVGAAAAAAETSGIRCQVPGFPPQRLRPTPLPTGVAAATTPEAGSRPNRGWRVQRRAGATGGAVAVPPVQRKLGSNCRKSFFNGIWKHKNNSEQTGAEDIIAGPRRVQGSDALCFLFSPADRGTLGLGSSLGEV